jgi:hypothetical protein
MRNRKLLFSDLTVDPRPADHLCGAEVPNRAGQLLPGLYAQWLERPATNAITLPQQVPSRATAQGDTVTCGSDGKVIPRTIKIILLKTPKGS